MQSDAYAQAEAFYSREFGDCEGDTGFYPDIYGQEPGIGRHRLQDSTVAPETVRTFCSRHGITENVFFTGVFGILLAKYNYTDQSVFTTIYHGRNDSRLANTVAMLVKTLPVRAKASGDTAAYFHDLQNLLMGAMSHDCYPFAEISRTYDIQPNALFAYQGDNFLFEEIGGYHAEMIPLQSQIGRASCRERV